MKNKNRLPAAGAAVLLSLALIVSLAGCASLDVVAKVSVDSMSALIDTSPVTESAAADRWVLTAPDKAAQFTWSKDFAATPDDLEIRVDAAPFLAAGLDPAKLSTAKLVEGQLVFGRDLGSEAFASKDQATALAAYQKLISLKREALGFHQALDHYGLDVGHGNKFEWAKDLSTNDKDIVFVLDPQALAAAGAKTSEIEGWLLAKVEMMDQNNKPIQVEKLLKPYSLR